jgi:UDP-N-acetylmuramoyl-L-alanyl-D-glutamate--2,6-diaminopimelate ligase
MTLNELLADLNIPVDASYTLDIGITGLALDSRKVAAGNVFIALAGAKLHGLEHLSQALNSGASAVLYDPAANGAQLAEASKVTQVPVIAVEGLAAKLGAIAARFYQDPSTKLDVIGITGTNGKTSCSQFLSQVLEYCGIIGTLGWGEWGGLNETLNTTPDALEVQKILAELLKQGKRTVAMEVSSHGLQQGRVNSVRFRGAVFTNISRDHLDYHETMEAYVDAKLKILSATALEFAVVNLDDAYSQKIISAVPMDARLWAFSTERKLAQESSDVSSKLANRIPRVVNEHIVASNILHKDDGIEFTVSWQRQHSSLIERQTVNVPLYGDFNVENVLAVLTVMLALGQTLGVATAKLANIKPVVGRMERVGDSAGPLVFVDYAHTPDALDKVLSCAKQHSKCALWVVFGCGGNRDAGKRPLMRAIAETWADHVIVTDDNPRYENGQDIVNDILAESSSAKIEVIRNREQAIFKAIKTAALHDCIVIAGKGHEQYQEIEGVRTPFSDSRVAIEALQMRSAN